MGLVGLGLLGIHMKLCGVFINLAGLRACFVYIYTIEYIMIIIPIKADKVG